MHPRLFFELAAFLLGLLFGSFLNVCISRLPQHRSIMKPASHCPECGHRVRPYDNVPLLSWLLLRGRCRDCGYAISWRYPVVELFTGVLFLAVALRTVALHAFVFARGSQFTASQLVNGYITLFGVLVLGFLLIGLTVMDWQTHRLPDAFTLSGLAIAGFLICSQAIFLGPDEADVTLSTTHKLRMSSPGSMAEQGNVFLTGPEHLIFGRLLAAAGIALLLLGIRAVYRMARNREGLGLGDVKMLAMIAAFLGFWPAMLCLFLATFLATCYALPLVVARRANALTRLPFGSFMGVAGLAVALFGTPVIEWYTSLFR